MTIKICYNSFIHRFSEVPSDITGLNNLVTATFSHLPPAWTLYYIDSEGDKVTLSDNQSYLELIQYEAKQSSKIIKIFVVEISDIPFNKSKSDSSSKLPENKDLAPEENDKKRGTSEMDKSERRSGNKKYSQAKSNKFEKADSSMSISDKEKKIKVPNGGDSQLLGKGAGREEKLYKVKDLFKRMTLGEVSDAEKGQIQQKLTELEKDLVGEEKEIFELKKEKFQLKAEKIEKKKQEELKEYEARRQEKINSDDKKPVHEGAICDNCGISPIIGVRYKCSVCKSFDNCERCEAALDHIHPLLKIKDPSILWKKSIRIKEEKDVKKPYGLYEALGAVEKMVDAKYRGESEVVETYYQKLQTRLIDKAKEELEPLLRVIVEEKDFDKMEKVVEDANAKLVEFLGKEKETRKYRYEYKKPDRRAVEEFRPSGNSEKNKGKRRYCKRKMSLYMSI